MPPCCARMDPTYSGDEYSEKLLPESAAVADLHAHTHDACTLANLKTVILPISNIKGSGRGSASIVDGRFTCRRESCGAGNEQQCEPDLIGRGKH